MNKENFEKAKKNVAQGVRSTAKTIMTIINFIVIIYIVWSAVNSDVVIKAIRYPEAVRELKIEVRVSQLAK